MTIAKSKYLNHTAETLVHSIPTVTASTETKKMNMCQAVNNAMDIALEKIDTAGNIVCRRQTVQLNLICVNSCVWRRCCIWRCISLYPGIDGEIWKGTGI
jgi:hypothetical protein